MKALVFVLLLGLLSLTACGVDPAAGSADTGTTIVDADADGTGADTASDDAQDSAPLDQQATLADVEQFTEVEEPDGALSEDSNAAADDAPDWNGTAASWPLDAGPNQGCLPGEFKAGPVCQGATCDSVGAYETAQLMALVYDHQTCTADADCAVVDMSTRCYPKCPYGVQKEFAAAAQAFADEFDAAVCIPFDVSEVCKTKDIILKCSPPSPGCVKGYCAADKQYETNDCLPPVPKGAKCFAGKWICDPGWTQPPHTVDCMPATCENIQGALQDAVAKLMAGPATDCVQDLDCAPLVLGTACGTLCTGAVKKSASQSAGALVSDWDTYCKEVAFPEKCVVPPIPSCPGKSLACMAGKCVFSKP